MQKNIQLFSLWKLKHQAIVDDLKLVLRQHSEEKKFGRKNAVNVTRTGANKIQKANKRGKKTWMCTS